MKAPVTLPAEAVALAQREPATPAVVTDMVSEVFSALAQQLRLKPADAVALFECALTSIELTPEVALAIPGGRELLRDEYERGLRSDADGKERYAKGVSGREFEIDRALEQRYPIPTKRVRNEFVTAFGRCWFADDQWYADDGKDVNGSASAVATCAAIGATDDEYPRVLALRDEPRVLVVSVDDPRATLE